MNQKPRSQEAKKPKAAVVLFSVFCVLLLVAGCKQSTDGNNAPGPVTAQLLEGSAFLPANVSEWYTYRIQMSDSRTAPDSIVCEVRTPGGATLPGFTLYDDGSVHALSGPSYASTTSTDIAAHDGQFTRQINSQLLANNVTGNYQFHFVFYGSGTYEFTGDNPVTVAMQNAGPCLISSYPHDSVFQACFAPDTLELHITPTEADAADTVRVRLLEGGDVLAQANFEPVSDDLWRLVMDPTFFRCVGSAQNAYALEYSVKTRFGMSCSTQVNLADFVNDRPSVSDPVLPDTILRPASGDTNRVVITVRLHDCEYLPSRDFDDFIVRYDVQKQGTTLWDQSPAYIMFDNAVAPDGHPFDGTFAGGLSVTHSDSLFDRLYYFRFYAIDCAPPFDTSQVLLDSVRLIQENPGTIRSGSTLPGSKSGAIL